MPSYSCLHCALRSLGFGFGTPFGVFWLALAAAHLAYFGGSGTTTLAGFWPVVCACCLTPARNQWLKSLLVIAVSPTLATASEGTESPPQPAIARAATARTASG